MCFSVVPCLCVIACNDIEAGQSTFSRTRDSKPVQWLTRCFQLKPKPNERRACNLITLCMSLVVVACCSTPVGKRPGGRCRRAWAQKSACSVHTQTYKLHYSNLVLCPLLVSVQLLASCQCSLLPSLVGLPTLAICTCFVLFVNATWEALTVTEKLGNARMRSPLARFYEHLQEIRSVKRAASYAQVPKKNTCFQEHTLG